MKICSKITFFYDDKRCPMYQNTPATCVQVTDPSDPCCTYPRCSPDPATGQTPIPVPHYNQAVTNMGVVAPPDPSINYNGGNPYQGVVIIQHTGFTAPPPTAPAGIDKSGNIFNM